MIEELTQPKGTEVPNIGVEDTLVSISGVTEGSSYLEDLPSPTLRIGNISKYLDIPIFLAASLTLLVKMTAGATY